MIGSLLYLLYRPLLESFLAVGILSQYLNCPTNFLVKSVHCVFGYLKGTEASIDSNLTLIVRDQTNLTSIVTPILLETNLLKIHDHCRLENASDFHSFGTPESKTMLPCPIWKPNMCPF